MAHVTPQFNIKTGSDSQLFFSREVTGNVPNNGKIVESAVEASDVYAYPQLTRRTGHSIAGTTESIESNELRKGRTKSAPRKGNSSSEGSLDIELSPETYDDIFEAALRNKWKPWVSDAESAIKFDYTEALKADQFISNGTEADGGLHSKYLVGVKGNAETGDAIVLFDSAEERAKYEIDELTCGTEDIKYSALAQYGGISGEDLYQEFQHLAVNTMSLSVSPGQIVTGSFGFMGSNNPDLLGEGDVYSLCKPQPSADEVTAGGYYVRSGEYPDFIYTAETTYDAGHQYYKKVSDGIIKGLVGDTEDGKAENNRFADAKDAEAVKAWVKDLANKVGTSTDQFTAREGFLYINGHRVQYGSNLTFELNNGLKQIFAIFEKGSISTSPMSLDITGTLDAYLIAGHSEDLYNMCSGDKDVEITFCFQDQEDNPEYLYVMQIFKAKFTNNDISQGSEELTVSLPFQSFEERACRFFRIRKIEKGKEIRSKIKDITFDNNTGKGTVVLYNSAISADAGDFTVTAIDGSTNVPCTVSKYKDGVAEFTFTSLTGTGDHKVTVTAGINGVKKTKNYTVNVA